MRISDWSSDVCSSDLDQAPFRTVGPARHNIVARVVVRLFDGIAAETRLIFQHRSDRRHVDLDGEIVAAAVSFAAGFARLRIDISQHPAAPLLPLAPRGSGAAVPVGAPSRGSPGPARANKIGRAHV